MSLYRRKLCVRMLVILVSLILTQALLMAGSVLAGGGQGYAVEELITHIPGLNLNLVDVRTETGLSVWFKNNDGTITLTAPIRSFTTAFGWSIVAGYPKVLTYRVKPYQAIYDLQWYFKHGICIGNYCLVDREIYYTSGVHISINHVDNGGINWVCLVTGIGKFERVVTNGDCA